MSRTVLLGEPPEVLADWLERRRALGQDGYDEVLIVDPARRSVEWYHRADTAFERTDGSALLELTEQTLAAEIDWPPLDG